MERGEPVEDPGVVGRVRVIVEDLALGVVAELPGSDRFLHRMVGLEERVERGGRRLVPGFALRCEEGVRPSRPGLGQPIGAGSGPHQSVDGQLVEDGLDVVRGREGRVDDATHRREALDRDRQQASIQRRLAIRRGGSDDLGGGRGIPFDDPQLGGPRQ